MIALVAATGRRSRQGRGLPVGNRKTKALARVLVADRTPAMPSWESASKLERV